MTMRSDAYREEIIEPGDEASLLAKEISYQSHGNCPALTVIPHQPGNFRGPVGFLWKSHILEAMLRGTKDPAEDWETAEEMENDGAGGKPLFSTIIGTPKTFEGLGWEIIAMTADDFARSGRFPAVIANELNCKKITKANFLLVKALFKGYGDALRRSGLVNITGEIAIMKHSITAFCDTGLDSQLIVTWGAACIGLAHRKLLLDPSLIRPGMPIVGFWELGYRCNGGTFLTNIILKKFGSPTDPDFWKNPAMRAFVKKLTVPSRSYAKTVSRIVGWTIDGNITDPLANIAGIAHITGGGMEKLREMLPAGVGARLYSMPKPAQVLLEAQKLSQGTKFELSDRQAYTTLHGGCGMLVVCNSNSDADAVIAVARRDNIGALRVGETVASKHREVEIHSRFLESAVFTLP